MRQVLVPEQPNPIWPSTLGDERRPSGSGQVRALVVGALILTAIVAIITDLQEERAVLAENAHPSRYQPFRPLFDIGVVVATW